MHQTRRTMAWSTCLLGVALLIVPLPPPGHLGWTPLLRDACHAALFALMGWACMRWHMQTCVSTMHATVRTFGVLLGVAAGTELAQSFTGRSMDVADFARDILGLLAGLGLALLPQARTRLVKMGLAAGVTGLLLFSTRDLILQALVVWRKDAAFPLLEDFEDHRSLRLWHLEHEGVVLMLQVVSDGPPAAGHALQLSIPATGLTSLHGDMRGGDWTGWTHLAFDGQLEAATALHLGLRIDGAEDQRLRMETLLQPGSNAVTVRLPDSAAARSALRRTGRLVLFVQDPGGPAALRIDNLRLVRP